MLPFKPSANRRHLEITIESLLRLDYKGGYEKDDACRPRPLTSGVAIF